MIHLTLEEEQETIETIDQSDFNISLDSLSLMQLGYHFLTDNAKLTYLYMRSLSNPKDNLSNKPICFTSLDYLSIISDSTINTQKNIINSLINCGLISKDPEGFIIHPPIIEKSFKETTHKLCYRKEITSLISYITTCNNPNNRIEHIKKLKSLIQITQQFPYLKSINETFKNKIKNIII